MRKILSLVLVLSILLGTALPISAFAAGAGQNTPLSDSGSATPTQAEEQVSSEEASGSAAGEGESTQSDNSKASGDERTPDASTVSDEPGEQTPEAEDPALGQSGDSSDSCADTVGGIRPLSGFEGGGSEFFTRIRLTVTDRQGNPIEGAVYGLYRMDNDMLVEELTTDRYGVATSGDVPADTDYYLLELYTPEGFLPNEERHDIILTDVCAPSRIDVSVVYDPIMGRIHVVKEDEGGNPIAGVGFYVYRVDGWELVDTIHTDENGEAWTTMLPWSLSGYELYEFDAPEDFVTGGYYSVHIYNHESDETVQITNYRASGSARIHKTATDGRNVQGAVYSIYRIPQIQAESLAADSYGGEWVCDITTNSGGYAYAYNLPMGDFYAVEKSVPSPYRLDETPQYFTLSYNGQTAYLDFVNEVDGEAGRLRILKTDDSGNYLSGVVFGLYRAWDGKKLAELTTGVTGIAEYYPLIPQDYYLLELTGKDGYTMVTDRIPFTVDGSGNTVELTVENPKIRIFGKVKVVKTDDAGNPVSGVRIGVYCHAGNLLEELVTGEDGTAVSGILNEGTGYYLMELEGAPGHLASDEKHVFEINSNGAIVYIVNPRISGGVKVIKTGEEQEPLPGVTFGVYQDGFLVETLITLEDGTAESGTLYYGDYELIELSTVEGYELLDTPIPFSITENGVVLEIPVTNPLIMGTITVVKVNNEELIVNSDGVRSADELKISSAEADSDNYSLFTNNYQLLSGAKFGLYNGQGQKLAELVTGEDGTASYTLPKGEFYLKELAAPEGFLLTDELIPFAIETQGQVVEKVVVNAQGFGTVKVIKSSDEGEESIPLPGVAFDVFLAATEEKAGEIVTGEDGTAALELPLGRYYLVETATAEGFQLLSGRVTFTLAEDGATVELPIANQRIPAPEQGGIRLTKKCAVTGDLLPNAVFGVYSAATDEKVGELTTDAAGFAAISLPAADYYLLEQTPPEGFEKLTEKIPVTVAEAAYTELTVENRPEEAVPGTLRVVKNAKGSGERLPDAVFGVYNAATEALVAEITTGKNGVASATLPEGDYYLLEHTPPKGFQKLLEPISFHIASGETLKLDVANDPETPPESIGMVRFVKKDKDSGKKLAGAVIGVYDADTDEKVAELTTDKEGAASYELAAGRYFWKELRSPEGFTLLEGRHSFAVTADKTIEIIVENEAIPTDAGTLRLIKKAAGTGESISDAVFGVYTVSGNRKVAEITTDDDGEAEIQLEPGRYYLKELSVPSPFVPESDKIPFTIKDVGKTVTIEASNTKGVGTVVLEKKDTDGKAVSGAVFTLYSRGGTRIAELTSGRDGTASYELPVGTGYYLVEKTAAVGYRLDSSRHTFSIRHGQTTTVEAVNEPIQGTVEVYFRHVSDSRELAEMKSLTDKVGTDYIKWMRQKGYENMPIGGYTLIRTDYPSSFVLIDGTLVVTLWYDSPAADTPDTDKPGGGIEIPKTGGSFPGLTFALSGLCWLVAAFCAVTLVKGRKQPATAADGAACSDTLPTPPAQEPTPTPSAASPKGGKKRRKGKR